MSILFKCIIIHLETKQKTCYEKITSQEALIFKLNIQKSMNPLYIYIYIKVKVEIALQTKLKGD